jgi:hypothetical protein
MSCAMSGTHGAKGLFHKGNNFLHPMTQLETGELKLTGHKVYILASGGEKMDATLGQLCVLACEKEPPSPMTIPSCIQRVRRLSSWRSSIVAVVKSKPQSRPDSSHCTCHLKPYRAGNRVTSDDKAKTKEAINFRAC